MDKFEDGHESNSKNYMLIFGEHIYSCQTSMIAKRRQSQDYSIVCLTRALFSDFWSTLFFYYR